MVAYQHPADLNPFQRFRQASSILRGTSRARNDGWYASPFSHDFQIHLRIDGIRCDSWIHQPASGTWSPGPPLGEELLSDPDKVPAFADDLIARARAAKASSVGVVLYLADEFATTEIDPELNNPGALQELRDSIVTEPGAVLGDASLSAEEHAWRLLPYPAGESDTIATAVTLSRRLAPLADAIREHGIARNFPLAVTSVSAPVVALLALPELQTGPLERPILAVLPYPAFTVLAFFNAHGDLQLVRTLQHRGHRRPSNLRHAAATTAAALEMAAPEVIIMPLARVPDPQFASDLRVVFENSTIREIDWSQTAFFHDAGTGDVPPEPVIALRPKQETGTPLAASHTFSTLREEGWALQDFLPVPATTAAIYPSRSDMKMLKLARQIRYVLLGLAVIAFGWTTVSVIDIVRRPEWAFHESDAQTVTGRLNVLNKESQKITHWENLLDDRSKGWTSMELLSRLFPEKSGFMLKTFSHTTNPESARGQTSTGFIKEWRMNGLAREDALERLSTLNTREGISAVFSEVARVTGNQSYRTDLPSRSVVINVRTQENSGFKPVPPEARTPEDETTYPFMFDLTITQRFENSDPMAINAGKAP